MNFVFDDSPHIRRLSERWHGIMQVLLPDFTLTKEEYGLLLEVKIRDDLPSIIDSEGKREFFSQVRKMGQKDKLKLIRNLTRFFREKRILSYRFDCSISPLRYGNGGVLPVIRLNSEDYFCLFYRDIFPIGWNIANGASDTLEEMLNPELTIFREFGEELFISDHEKNLIYTFDPEDESMPPGFQRDALQTWKKIFHEYNLNSYKQLPIPLKWIHGPDRIRVHAGKRSNTSSGYFISITPEDNAIELDRIALINLKDNVTFFDGEYSRGILLNRIVGLFQVNHIQDALENPNILPDRVFFNGVEGNPDDLDIMVKENLQSLESVRSSAEKQAYRAMKAKFGFCPITKSIIHRYFQWIEAEKNSSTVSIQADRKREIAAAESCDIFISFNHDDLQIARWLYQYLTEHYRVFCSVESLIRLGVADYCKAIDKALESACCLIVLGTRAEYFDDGWVKYEWRSFINEYHSGRKPHGRVFTFVSNVSIDQLPIALRSFQVIPYSTTSPQDSFENLVRYIGVLKK